MRGGRARDCGRGGAWSNVLAHQLLPDRYRLLVRNGGHLPCFLAFTQPSENRRSAAARRPAGKDLALHLLFARCEMLWGSAQPPPPPPTRLTCVVATFLRRARVAARRGHSFFSPTHPKFWRACLPPPRPLFAASPSRWQSFSCQALTTRCRQPRAGTATRSPWASWAFPWTA